MRDHIYMYDYVGIYLYIYICTVSSTQLYSLDSKRLDTFDLIRFFVGFVFSIQSVPSPRSHSWEWDGHQISYSTSEGENRMVFLGPRLPKGHLFVSTCLTN